MAIDHDLELMLRVRRGDAAPLSWAFLPKRSKRKNQKAKVKNQK
jgi:hypothetical protein